MRKVISILLICIIVICFAGCNWQSSDNQTGNDGQVGNNGYKYEYFYGVVRYCEDLGRLVVYITSFGEVEIPESDAIESYFNRIEQKSYQLKHGDLVMISFRYQKNYDDDGVAIMECYPARCDRKAQSIKALQENIEFEKVDQGYTFSFPSNEEIESKEIGDSVHFARTGGKNGVMYVKVYATGIITAKENGIFKVDLTFYEDANKFLDYYNEMWVGYEGPVPSYPNQN